MRTLAHLPSALLALPLLLLAATAAAQGGPPAVAPAPAAPSLAEALTGAAKAAYDTAKLLLVNQDFAGALAKFQEAYDLAKDPRLLSDMAICAKNLHAYARMQGLLERYVREAPSMGAEQRAVVDAALTAVKGLVGTLDLTVTPEGATVTLDGVSLGTAPLAPPVVVDLGAHTLSVRKDGWVTSERSVEITGGSTSNVTVDLTAAPHIGTLNVTSDEAATIAIDGTVVGRGAYRDKVAAGPHVVRVTEAGHVAYESRVDLSDAEVRTLEVSLKEEKHAVVWPWVVGGAAVVAGAIVGGYFLFQPSDTTTPVPKGTLPDGEITLKRVRLAR